MVYNQVLWLPIALLHGMINYSPWLIKTTINDISNSIQIFRHVMAPPHKMCVYDITTSLLRYTCLFLWILCKSILLLLSVNGFTARLHILWAPYCCYSKCNSNHQIRLNEQKTWNVGCTHQIVKPRILFEKIILRRAVVCVE